MTPSPIALIVNPVAGGGRAARLLPAVEAALAGHGLSVRTARTSSLDDARALAAGAAAAGETVVTLGGDGLVGAVADALRGAPGAVLGVLPGGRGNDLARTLGIPRDAVEACATIARGVARPLDVGEAGGRTFVGIASCGFDSDANRIANEAKWIKGQAVYLYAALRALAQWKPVRFELELDGSPLSFVGYTVACANSKAYGGGMFIAPDADLADGMLDVVIVERSSRLHFLRMLPSVFKGRHVRDPGVRVLRAREVVVRAGRPFTMYADGDPIAELPATVRAVRHALRVLVPAAS